MELEDGLSTPSGYSLQGSFELGGFGIGYTSGTISSGMGIGTFKGGGIYFGGATLKGNARLLRKPKETECECGK